MAIVAGGSAQWMAVHWIFAAALSLFVVTGLVVLSGGTRLTDRWWTMAAWAVVVVGALWTTATAVAEATVITQAAVAGDVATIEAWEVFAEALAMGVAFLALAVVAIAGNEARTVNAATPTWASWIAVLAGIVSFVGFVADMGLGIALGGVVWVVASIVLGLWTLWFGVALLRLRAAEPTRGCACLRGVPCPRTLAVDN